MRPSPRSYLSVPDHSDRIDFVRLDAPSHSRLQEARTVEPSQIIELIILVMAGVGTVTAIGAMWSLGRHSSYDD